MESAPAGRKRGPYRRYLTNPNAPIPRTTMWRMKQSGSEASFHMCGSSSSVTTCSYDGDSAEDGMQSSDDNTQGSDNDMQTAEEGGMQSSDDESQTSEDGDSTQMLEEEDDSDGETQTSDEEEHSMQTSEEEVEGGSEFEDSSLEVLKTNRPETDSIEDPEVDKRMFEPLYPGAQITVCGAYCAIMEFKRVCRLPFTAIAMLLQLLQLICPPGNRLPRSVYAFKKFFQRYTCAYTKRKFCPSCTTELEPRQRRCPSTGCANQEPDTLIEVPPRKAIKRIVARHWEKLQYPLLNTEDPSIVYDIHTGAGYRNLGGSGFFRYPEHIGVFFNTDGISLFKSARLTVWPIYLALASLPPSIRMNRDNLITCGVWVGQSKPPMTVFLPLLVKQMDNLNAVGIKVNTCSGLKTVRMKALFGVFDLIAKAPVMNMTQFNGKNGCPTCLHPGMWRNTQVYLPGNTYDLRTDRSINDAARKAEENGHNVAGIKGRSVLSGFINLAKGIPVDYMHCVLEGVVKALLGFWLDSKHHHQPYYIARSVKELDSRLLGQTPPHDFSRAPRSINTLRNFWKASELRNWLLFYSLPLLVGLLPPLYIHHLALLVCAMHILLQTKLTSIKIQAAEEMLRDFYNLLPELYGDRSCTANAHSLTHLAHYVRLWGPLWSHSAFAFESMNGYLTTMVHSKYRIADQLLFSIDVCQTLQVLCDKLEEVESEQTLSFLSDTLGNNLRHNMKQILPGSYSIGSLHRYPLSQEEQKALADLTGNRRISEAVVFSRLYHRGTILHSTEYGRGDGKRNSTVCSFLINRKEKFGVVQKFFLCRSLPPIALVRVFRQTSSSFLKTVGNPGRDTLQRYVHIDLLTAFIVQVHEKLPTTLYAVRITDVCCKCICIHCPGPYEYVVKMPNNFEHH